ncbi:MAG: hypothetical protein AAF513_02980 [Pseudomonadota bacterium]
MQVHSPSRAPFRPPVAAPSRRSNDLERAGVRLRLFVAGLVGLAIAVGSMLSP